MQEATFIDLYPKINTFYEIEWTCETLKNEADLKPAFIIESAPRDGSQGSNKPLKDEDNTNA